MNFPLVTSPAASDGIERFLRVVASGFATSLLAVLLSAFTNTPDPALAAFVPLGTALIAAADKWIRSRKWYIAQAANVAVDAAAFAESSPSSGFVDKVIASNRAILGGIPSIAASNGFPGHDPDTCEMCSTDAARAAAAKRRLDDLAAQAPIGFPGRSTDTGPNPFKADPIDVAQVPANV